jgi:TRAP-type C4-dicarboxylate transport system permease large subunit
MGVASTVEYGVSYTRHLLVLLLLISAATATGIRAHIALRPPRSVLDHRVAQGGQLIANLLLFASWYAHWRIDQAAGLVVQHPILPVLWMAGFAVMILLNVALIARPPANATPGGTLGHAMLAVPLYASMAMIAGGYFLFAEGHPSGLAIYLTKLTEHSTLYIFVGLYVWVGMLLKGTRLARLAFDVVRPWRLPAELLAVLVVVVAAVPTAYSGASGIFVMATAAIIFEELMRAGARKNLALAATAMSGGLGVVLNPCLLVVIVASLNKEVTTDQIYGWGTLIFGATAAVLLLGALIAARRKFVKPNVGEAASESGRVLLYLLPYVLIGGAVLLVYGLGLDTGLDEHSAPTVLPVVLLSLLVYDRIVARRRSPLPDEPGVLTTVSAASRETSTQIGALLLLMGLSVCLGGIVERGDLMSVLPALGSPIAMMVLLVAVLVVIGMTMDPYGAVILVSASIARLAYDSGIDPLHFWLTVLVAFELGYLTPPVALNHLLVRQVVDTDAIPEDTGPRASYWRRHEQTLLPVVIMGTRLLIVAFLPFFW